MNAETLKQIEEIYHAALEISLEKREAFFDKSCGAAHSLAGNETESAAILEQLLEMRRTDYVPAICLARIYSRIGEDEKAIEWLEKAFDERNGEMVFLQGKIQGAASGDSLHSLADNPRLIDLLQKMNLP